MAEMVHHPDELFLGLVHALRAAGSPVPHDKAALWLRAATLVGLSDLRGVRTAGHATLCTSREQIKLFDDIFDEWFDLRGRRPSGAEKDDEADDPDVNLLPAADAPDAGESDQHRFAMEASEVELLRHRDVATLSATEKAIMDRLIGTLVPQPPCRRSRRRTAFRRGELDTNRVLRHTLRRMGEPGELAWRQQNRRPRRVLLLVDVSKSMSAYADAHLRVSQRFATTLPGTEVFSMGTRLTRITRALRISDPDRALLAAGQTVPDWAGGTRLGENLKVFLDRWGQRGLARGAIVVIFSDGWEHGGVSLLQQQIRRMRRIAHRIVWVNPHRAKHGYEPLQSGVVAVLPHLDEFIGGHSQATFQELCKVVAQA